MNKFEENWHRKIPYHEWVKFIEYSRLDHECMRLWEEYKVHKITYSVFKRYEYNLYLQFIREKKLLYITT